MEIAIYFWSFIFNSVTVAVALVMPFFSPRSEQGIYFHKYIEFLYEL